MYSAAEAFDTYDAWLKAGKARGYGEPERIQGFHSYRFVLADVIRGTWNGQDEQGSLIADTYPDAPKVAPLPDDIDEETSSG